MAKVTGEPSRHLTSEEREHRQRYIVAHLDEPEPVPTTAGYAPVQDWLDELAAAEAAAQAAAEAPAAVAEVAEPPAVAEVA